jgi:Papain-like cysteine protease AvrRpt2
MPLEVQNGTALNPQAGEAPPPETRKVDINHHFQEGKLWCWAACIQMVLGLHGDQRSQCDIIKVKLGNQHQCAPDFQSRTESCDAPLMAQTWRNCGILEVIPDDGDMKIEDIKAEIAANRPIEIGILWNEGGGHAVLIKGWAATSPETLLIDDPLRESPLGPSADGSGRATHDELVAAFGHGTWRYTWSHLE